MASAGAGRGSAASPLSSHNLLSDYSRKALIRRGIRLWAGYLVLLAVSLLPPVRSTLTEWRALELWGPLEFLLDVGLHFWWVAIPVALTTWVALRHRQVFKSLRIYEHGLGLVSQEVEQIVPWSEVELSMGTAGERFFIEIKSAGLKQMDYAWIEFSEPAALQAHLRRFGTWC